MEAVKEAEAILKKRQTEIRREDKRITSLLDAFGSKNGKARRKPSRKKKATPPPDGKTRADQAVEFIGKHPGVEVNDLAKMMGLPNPNYLYKVLPELEKAGRIERQDKGFVIPTTTDSEQPTEGVAVARTT